MASLATRTARACLQVRNFSKGRYKSESPIVWKDGNAATATFGKEVGALKNMNSQFTDLANKSKTEASSKEATDLRNANFLFGAAVSAYRGDAAESAPVETVKITPAEAEFGKKVVKLIKGVQLPKQIKDSWRAGIANSLFAVGSLLNAHSGIQTEFAGILKGLHSSSKVADYFRSQVNPVSRAQAVTGLLESAGASPLFVALCSKVLAQGYLRDLETINDHYLELLSMGNKEVKGVVVSADKLEASEQEQVRTALAKTLPGQKLVLDFKVDESVLGGLSVQVGSNYADLTLRKRLNVLVDRQAGTGGELQPLVKPSNETPAAWSWAAEDVAAQSAKL